MAQKIQITVDGKEFTLTSCSYNVYRPADSSGKPAGGAQAGQLVISRESGDDTFFYEWAIDNATRKSGSVKFTKMNVEDTLKTLKFENAFIVDYSESCVEGTQMAENITISAQKLSINNATITNPWPEGA